MDDSMRALGIRAYGPLEQMEDLHLPIPRPGSEEVLVRVFASALNPADYKVVTGKLKFLHGRRFPLVVGYDFSGRVEEVGPGVSGLKVGDAVFGFLPYSPGNQRGAFAEKLVARADQVALKPDGVSDAQAASAATPALTAIQAIRDCGRLASSGGRVLITGVSGGVGSIAVGVAKRLGAEVTAVGSGQGLEIARALGAQYLIDRKRQSITEAPGGPFDVIFDAAAAYRWSHLKGLLKPGGAFVSTLPSAALATDFLSSLLSGTRVRFVNVKSRPADLELLGRWLSSGLQVHLDSTVSLEKVSESLIRLERGQVLGRVAVRIG